MQIRSIDIKNIMGGCLKHDCENINHIKSLPCLSIVQSVHGYYDIGLGKKAPCSTEEGGAFVAPAGIMQSITHHNGSGGYMEAQWVFMNITINDAFDYQDVFELPTLLPSVYREKLFELISVIITDSSICQKYAAAYQLADILIAASTAKSTVFDNTTALLKRYIDEHYNEPITKEALANVAFCSVPGLYRIFQKSFHLSPRNYINKLRLEKASVLLEISTRSVTDISQAVGFDDPVYFSKLFKQSYKLSPQKYRELMLSISSRQNDS